MTDTPAAKRQRPLSPHLQVYRLPLPALTSIAHRITGVGLTVGTLLLVWWLVAAAAGPDAYATASGFIASPIGLLLMFGWTAALWYHLLNGLRHLIWDGAKMLTLEQSYSSAKLVIGGAVVATVVTWVVAFAV
ncbi:succinate dehydrogenase [alpha proteobacterium AAP38]|jgi:succinate dehydrogenase / fumarate reductase cytochrome b subunit|uniref:succinate dehydrogenase, cytochrome b556 subunit n=1 Tax=Niveispirillum sp. TaxID=1917217 RepID=UPI0006BA097E|nr:succinate dehydrogenase [alpha proteobacterium AAP38]